MHKTPMKNYKKKWRARGVWMDDTEKPWEQLLGENLALQWL
jgi:hypothetical protein